MAKHQAILAIKRAYLPLCPFDYTHLQVDIQSLSD